MNAVERPTRHRTGLPLPLVAVVGVLFVWAIWGLDLSLERLLAVPGQVAKIVGLMFPPDVDYGKETAAAALLESLQIAWVGTVLGAFLSLPLVFIGAANLFPRIARTTRFFLAGVRAVPEILLAIYFVPVVGLGAFAGTLAIGIHSIGMLGRLGADVVEALDHGPVEAVEAAGGTRLHVLRFAVLPQVLPELLGLWLYRFEINLRASAVLGVVGGGGIGGVLLNALRYRRFDKAGIVLILTVVAVLVVDAASGALRRRITRD